MTGWPRALAAGCLAALAGVAPPAAADQPVPHHRLFAFTDPDVIESSGLVDRGRLVLTINDSGDGPVVYGIDPRSGATVSHTTYSSGDVTDVEALAPAAGGAVWVGDIGDNRASRDDISVYRVQPVSSGDHSVPAQRFGLTYPGGARDAETLLAQPRTGRLFVVSKSVFGGTVYAAPRHLREGADNRLRPFARVDGLVTDGTFFPDGKHVLLRTYGTASVYSFPDFRLVGTVTLPAQRQGEGISLGPGGRVLLSSEGVHAPVLEVSLPHDLARPGSAAGPRQVGPSPDTRPPSHVAHPHAPARSGWDWAGIGLVGLGLGLLGLLSVRLSRIRGR